MKAAYKFPTLPAVALEANRSLKNMLVLSVSLVLAISAFWYLKSAASAPAPAPYRAPTLGLVLSGAMNLSLTDWGGVDAAFSPEGFALTFNDAPVAFGLEFEGSTDAETTVYDLSSGTYPLTLRLLDGGEGYHLFTATQGTVEMRNGEATVTAFLSDELGRQLFLNARFDTPERSQVCSESYRLCFNAL